MRRDTGTYTADKAHRKMLVFIATFAPLNERIGKDTLCCIGNAAFTVGM